MMQHRPFLAVGLAAGAGFASCFLLGAAALFFFATGGFGAAPPPRAQVFVPVVQYVAVTPPDVRVTQVGLRIDPRRKDMLLEAADYAPLPRNWVDQLEGGPIQSDVDEFAFGDDGRLYRDPDARARAERAKKARAAEARKLVSASAAASPS